MKKILSLICLLLVSGCIRAGDYDLVPVRKKILNMVNGYTINFADTEKMLLRSEDRREHNFVLNKALTVKKGETVLSDKFFVVDMYETIAYVPSKKGALQTTTVPTKLSNRQEYKILGTVSVDGAEYNLLPSGLDDYVFLFDNQGNFYNKAGWVDDGTLKLLDEDVFVYPSDLKMKKVIKNSMTSGKVYGGYEIKYGGVKLDRVWFDYLAFEDDEDAGEYERISFPNKPGLIMINGNGFRILEASDDALTYMILTTDE